MWALLIAMGFAVTGFTSHDACEAAAKAAQLSYDVHVCVQIPAGGELKSRQAM